MKFIILSALCSALGALAGFPPSPEDVTIKQIANKPGVSISYKQTTICESKSKGYAGYVHMPSSYLGDVEPIQRYNVSLCFWYFEARQNPHNAQTAVYLAGGPGESSMFGAALSSGPCTVLPDSNSTEDNPWSWNRYVNMLYIDQPVGTGFSYDKLANSTKDLLWIGAEGQSDLPVIGFETHHNASLPIPAENTTFLYGTFPSQDNPFVTPSTSELAARMLWHFLQVWIDDFPECRTEDKRLSFWGNSYGGYWVPFSAAYTQQQNLAIKAGKINGTVIPLDTAGWTNGCSDALYQGEWYPDMAYNNTYGLQVLSDDAYAQAKAAWSTEGGLRDQILQCRELGDLYDPEHLGINETVNSVCYNATLFAAINVLGAFNVATNRSVFDIAHLNPDPLPPTYVIGFFNQDWVQRDLGVPLNFTDNSYITQGAFFQTGDPMRAAGAKKIEYLLESGIKVSMIYGDRDYQCPWNGAEKLSLALNWTGATQFRAAGYEDIHTSDCYTGGVVRQHGNMSFSRVFQAGHDAAWYQPRTVFEIFTRSMLNMDVATGKKRTMGQFNDYSSVGPSDSYGIRQKLPPPPAFECNLWSVGSSCTVEQYAALVNGTAEIEEFRVVKPVGVTAGAIGSAGGL